MTDTSHRSEPAEVREAITQLREQLTEEYLADPHLLAEAVAAIHASRRVIFGGWRPATDDDSERGPCDH